VHTPLAQSGPVVQLVFGSGFVVSQRPPVHLPLWQSLASVQKVPPGAAPPVEVPASEPPWFAPPWFEPPWSEPPWSAPPEPPEFEPPWFEPPKLKPPWFEPPWSEPPWFEPPAPESAPSHTPRTQGRPAQSCDRVHFPPVGELPLCSLELQAKAATPTSSDAKNLAGPRRVR
jgi:hypothetical protein